MLKNITRLVISLTLILVSVNHFIQMNRLHLISKQVEKLQASLDSSAMGVYQKDPKVGNQDWDNLYNAICMVESSMDPLAKNPTSSATGICQQLLSYVDDANRLQNQVVYTYEDRKNPDKAREMFEIVQSKYNPDRNHMRAIGMHYLGPNGYLKNPWKAMEYIQKVQKVMSHQN